MRKLFKIQIEKEEYKMSTGINYNALVGAFSQEIKKIEGDEARYLFFTSYLNDHPELAGSGHVRDVFQILVRQTTFIHKAFEVLIDCLTDNITHYSVIGDMIWKYLILNDGIGGHSINNIMQYFKDHRKVDYHKVMNSIKGRIGKLKNAPLFREFLSNQFVSYVKFAQPRTFLFI